MKAQMNGIQDIEVFKYRFKCSDLYHNQLTDHQEGNALRNTKVMDRTFRIVTENCSGVYLQNSICRG